MEEEAVLRRDAGLAKRPPTAPGAPPRRRILFFNTWSTAHGGSATSLIDIASGLDPAKYEPLVLCPEQGTLTERLREAGIPVAVHSLSSMRGGEAFRFSSEVPWYVRYLRRNRIDLVHGNTGGSRRSVVLAAWLCGIPYVQHVRNPVRDARNGFAYRIATRIIANSDAIAAPLRADPLFARKTLTVYNAVDLSLYDDTGDRRGELGLANRPIIGFVGQLVPRKGTKVLIEAMPRILGTVPEAILVIVGCAPPGEPEYERECRDLVVTLGLSDQVRFVGYRRDVPAWMRTFDVFALPTRSEPFGKVVIEAMAARCPVVASGVGGIPEIVRDPGLGTLISADDPPGLAREILRFLTNADLAARVGGAAARHVRERFSLRAMMQQLEQVYDSILAAQEA